MSRDDRYERRKSERLGLADKYCELADKVLLPPRNPASERTRELVKRNHERRDMMRRLLADARRKREAAERLKARARETVETKPDVIPTSSKPSQKSTKRA